MAEIYYWPPDECKKFDTNEQQSLGKILLRPTNQPQKICTNIIKYKNGNQRQTKTSKTLTKFINKS